jgi:hypothetical protein
MRSVEFLKYYVNQNPNSNLRYLHDKGQGIYQAMTLGVKHTHSAYFTFWNAGDELHSDYEMSRLLDELGPLNADWILTNGDFNWIEYPTPSIENLRRFVTQEERGYISHQCILFKTNLYAEKQIYNFKYKVAADTQQIFKCYQNSDPAILDFPIVSVELGAFSSVNNRRARFEVLIIVITSLRGWERLNAIKNILIRELRQLLERSSQSI